MSSGFRKRVSLSAISVRPRPIDKTLKKSLYRSTYQTLVPNWSISASEALKEFIRPALAESRKPASRIVIDQLNRSNCLLRCGTGNVAGLDWAGSLAQLAGNTLGSAA